MNELQDLGQHVFLGNDLAAWTKALVTFGLWFTVLPLAKGFVSSRLRRLDPAQPHAALELVLGLLQRTSRTFLVVVATYLALQWLALPAGAGRWVTRGTPRDGLKASAPRLTSRTSAMRATSWPSSVRSASAVRASPCAVACHSRTVPHSRNAPSAGRNSRSAGACGGWASASQTSAIPRTARTPAPMARRGADG